MELVAQLAPKTFLAFAFALGAVVGSFLNVVIARLPAGGSIVSPPSRCPRCQRPIAWYDNVPIVSWLLLRARCRGCALPISARYPLVEALTGVLSLLLFRQEGPTLTGLGLLVFSALLVALSFIDLDHFWLPESLSLPLLGLGLLSPLWNRGLGSTFAAYDLLPGRPLLQAFVASFAGAIAGGGMLWLVGVVGTFVFKKEAMGLGDVVLLAGIGAWLGIQSLFFVLMFSSLQGSAVGLLVVARRRRQEPHAAAPGVGPAAAVAAPAADADADADAAAAAAAAAAPDAVPASAISPSSAPSAGESAKAGDEWQPDPHHVPFGPFLAIAALEQVLFGEAIWGGWLGLMNQAWNLIDRLTGRG